MKLILIMFQIQHEIAPFTEFQFAQSISGMNISRSHSLSLLPTLKDTHIFSALIFGSIKLYIEIIRNWGRIKE